MKAYELISIFTYSISRVFPKKSKRWVFGAWFGDAVSDNTKAFYDYIEKNHPEIERIWVATDPSRVNLPGCKVVKRNSLTSLMFLLTARVAVMNQGFGDLAAYNFLGGTYKVQLWHGVAWKKIGRDAVPNLKGFYEKIFQFINHYDLYIAPSKIYGESVKTAFKTDDSHILYIGQPRNVSLFSEEFKQASRDKIESIIGVSPKRIIAYMPTFRDKTSRVFSFHFMEEEVQFKELAHKYGFVVIEKLHYKSHQNMNKTNKESLVYGLPNVDATVLLGAADCLITDYSSCFFDYLITDRPVIHFTYDYDYYKNKDRGLYYDISDVAAGTIAITDADIFDAIDKNCQGDPGKWRRRRVKERFISFESKENCEVIYRAIVNNLNR